MSRNLQVIDYTLSKTDSKGINTNIPFPTSFKEAKTLQQANAVIAAYVNANTRELEDHQSEIDEHTETLEQIADDLVDITEDIEDLTTSVNDLTTNKQDNLISGTNIKTINNESILGSGNIDIQGGAGSPFKGAWDVNITYSYGDIVSYDLDNITTLYVSLIDNNVGNDPDVEDVYGSTIWQLFNVAYYTNLLKTNGVSYLASYANNDDNSYFTVASNLSNNPTVSLASGLVKVKSLSIGNVQTQAYTQAEKNKVGVLNTTGDGTKVLKDNGAYENILINEYSNDTDKAYTAGYISAVNSYSVNETPTGGLWINGKPIYRKVIQFTTPSSGNTNVSLTNLVPENLETAVDMKVVLNGTYWKYAGSSLYNHTNAGGDNYMIAISIENPRNFRACFGNNWLNKQAYIVIEYTKTTDIALYNLTEE